MNGEFLFMLFQIALELQVHISIQKSSEPCINGGKALQDDYFLSPTVATSLA